MTQGDVVARTWTSKLLAGPIAVSALVLVSAPIEPVALRLVFIAIVLAVAAWLVVRALRMGVIANDRGLRIQNWGRDYQYAWSEVESLDSGLSDNVTRSVSTLTVRLTDGTKRVCRGASAYSARRVEVWRTELIAAAPPWWRDESS